jgi:hypothetical protein
MEKNYGRAFPKAWLWAQGVKQETRGRPGYDDGDDMMMKGVSGESRKNKSVAFVLSYGEVTHGR